MSLFERIFGSSAEREQRRQQRIVEREHRRQQRIVEREQYRKEWKAFEERKKEVMMEFETRDRKERADEASILIRRLSLTCDTCGKLASPIFETENRYRCLRCGRQFATQFHGINRAISGILNSRRNYSQIIEGPGRRIDQVVELSVDRAASWEDVYGDAKKIMDHEFNSGSSSTGSG